MEWIKQKLRGTIVHRIVRWLRGQEPPVTSRWDAINAAYDRQTIQVLRKTLGADSIAIDIGAHSGAILQSIVELAPRAKHHAFEPLPHLAQELRRSFPSVDVHQVAVSDHTGQAEFQFVESSPAYSGLQRRVYDEADPKITTIPVQVTTLDETIPASERIAFIKIDIEGGEYHALKGGTETIRRSRPVIVFEAGSKSTGQYGVSPAQVYELITSTFGYELSTMDRWLKGRAPYTLAEFEHNWEHGPDFYFIAAPRKAS